MKGWKYILTYGYSLNIYGRGDKRIAIDENTGKVVLEYTIRR